MKYYHPIKLFLLSSLIFFRTFSSVYAQTTLDSSNNLFVKIVTAQSLIGINQDTLKLSKLIGHVAFDQAGTLMYCDSAYFNQAANSLEAFGNVRIIQPSGTEASSDYLQYKGNTKMALMKGNVSLIDNKGTLHTEILNYNLGTKIGTYNNGGTLITNNTNISSNKGTYNLSNKEARFTDSVFITDPQYNIVSDDLGYNTNTKIVKFFAPSIVTNDKSELHTSKGYYDTKNEIAQFNFRSSIRNEAQYIEGDKIDYNRHTGYGNATGHVIAMDTLQKTTLWAGYASYNEKNQHLLAYKHPLLRKENITDSVFIKADTFFAAPEILNQLNSNSKLKKSHVDSASTRYFIGYKNVLIFTDSLQGKCDSISYSQKDSVLKMMKTPIVWSRKTELSGDTILIYNDSNAVKYLYIPNNALAVSQSGPEKAALFNQIQGKTLQGFFLNKKLNQITVSPHAACIYFAKDEYDAYIGVNEATSERMKIFFENQEMTKIFFGQDVKQKMSPLDKVKLENLRLNKFQWRENQRPKTIQELFDY